ncbi:hypothetical protein CPB84DRAFT_1753470 [Gymnopilus junonius]|uniref:F-box domain-containing protein n=1 Tax=Gymnopilus junonius TaxID=109634 RepID=A0A9P5N7S7_GYMJU|nr:hypothetical protein CPB84DRAFT_1753470 [Gymnopilus junonius]
MVLLFLDVISEIIEYLYGDEESLTACALVSTELLHIARRVRFRHITLDIKTDDDDRMQNLAEMSSIIIPRMRVLTLYWSTKKNANRRFLSLILKRILSAAALNELHLYGRYKTFNHAGLIKLAQMDTLQIITLQQFKEVPATLISNRFNLTTFGIHGCTVSSSVPLLSFQQLYPINAIYKFDDLFPPDEHGILRPRMLSLGLCIEVHVVGSVALLKRSMGCLRKLEFLTHPQGLNEHPPTLAPRDVFIEVQYRRFAAP